MEVNGCLPHQKKESFANQMLKVGCSQFQYRLMIFSQKKKKCGQQKEISVAK